MLADSHVHLHAYSDEEIARMLARARAADVMRIVAVSVDPASARRTVDIARRWPDEIIPAVGIHPLHEGDPDDFPRDAAIRAIGECGVDTVEGRRSLEAQLETLARQAQLARELDKPLLLHVRTDAVDAVLTTVRDVPSVVHYFVGDDALARRYLDAGLLISLGKPVTRPENEALRRAAALIPLDALLLETDTYPLPGRTTEPADVAKVAATLAELRGTTVEAIAEATTANLERLLRL